MCVHYRKREIESVSVSGERERITEHAAAAAAEQQSSSSRAEHRSSDGIQEARTLRVQVGLNPNCTDNSLFG